MICCNFVIIEVLHCTAPTGVVTFSRYYVVKEALPNWAEVQSKLPRLHISSEGTIEDEGQGMLQVDFANK